MYHRVFFTFILVPAVISNPHSIDGVSRRESNSEDKYNPMAIFSRRENYFSDRSKYDPPPIYSDGESFRDAPEYDPPPIHSRRESFHDAPEYDPPPIHSRRESFHDAPEYDPPPIHSRRENFYDAPEYDPPPIHSRRENFYDAPEYDPPPIHSRREIYIDDDRTKYDPPPIHSRREIYIDDDRTKYDPPPIHSSRESYSDDDRTKYDPPPFNSRRMHDPVIYQPNQNTIANVRGKPDYYTVPKESIHSRREVYHDDGTKHDPPPINSRKQEEYHISKSKKSLPSRRESYYNDDIIKGDTDENVYKTLFNILVPGRKSQSIYSDQDSKAGKRGGSLDRGVLPNENLFMKYRRSNTNKNININKNILNGYDDI